MTGPKAQQTERDVASAAGKRPFIFIVHWRAVEVAGTRRSLDLTAQDSK
jgi:hypothetical protein